MLLVKCSIFDNIGAYLFCFLGKSTGKYFDSWNDCCDYYSKMWTVCFNHTVIRPKDAAGMANSRSWSDRSVFAVCTRFVWKGRFFRKVCGLSSKLSFFLSDFHEILSVVTLMSHKSFSIFNKTTLRRKCWETVVMTTLGIDHGALAKPEILYRWSPNYAWINIYKERFIWE